MILLLALAVATLIACEIALRLPLGRVLATLRGTTQRVVTVIRSPVISDIWKEKVLPAYAWRIMKASLGLFACLLTIVVPVVAIAALATGSLAVGSASLMQPLPLIVMIVVGAGYVYLRKKLVA